MSKSCPRSIFASNCAAHLARPSISQSAKRFNHPVVGEVILAYEELAITADPGQILMIYTAEPGSASAERLSLLASWASTETADTAK